MIAVDSFFSEAMTNPYRFEPVGISRDLLSPRNEYQVLNASHLYHQTIVTTDKYIDDFHYFTPC